MDSSSSSQSAIALERNPTTRLGGALIGKMEAAKEFHRGTMSGMIQKGWNLKGEVEILGIERNVFVFQFSERSDYYRILRGRPWAIQSHLLNLQLWDDDMILKEVCFDLCPIWVQFHGLPFGYMNKANAVKLGLSTGEVVMVEDPMKNGTLIRNFLRVRVLVNLKNPLMKGFWIPRDKKKDVWVEVRYERLPSFCYRCGIIGHEQKACSKTEAVEDEDKSWGSWLKCSPPKFMEDIIVTVDMNWCEAWKKKETAARRLNFSEARGGDSHVYDNDLLPSQEDAHGLGRANASPQMDTKPRSERMLVRKASAMPGERQIEGEQERVDRRKCADEYVRAQKTLAIRSPMKHFYTTSSSKLRQSAKKLNAHESLEHLKEDGGRIGPVILLDATEASSSKALVVYVPNSPTSEVIGKLGEVKLKRSPPKIESPRDLKRSKQVMVDAAGFHGKGDEKKVSPKRKSVRRIKQHLRRKNVVQPSAGSNSEEKKDLFVEMVASTIAEGMSGWPPTALPLP